MNKKKAQGIHAKRRALQRQGLVVGKETLNETVQQIQKNKGTFLRKHTNRVTEWLVTVHGKCCRVLYDKTRRAIITFLPDKKSDSTS